MIYVGLIDFTKTSEIDGNDLRGIVGKHTPTAPILLKKKSLLLCYETEKINKELVAVWENSFSLLIGRVFDKTCAYPVKKKDFDNVSYSNKENFLKEAWGEYIYICSNEKGTLFEIFVDPSGRIPFFYYLFPNGNILFSSSIEIICSLLKQKASFNWTYLCSYLIYGNSNAIFTPFKDIYELSPSCCLEITKDGRTTKPFWNPLISYENLSLPLHTDIVTTLLQTLKLWLAPYKNICISLSGGVDSSALAYCLKAVQREEQTLVALNCFHGSVKTSNEIQYAQTVCQELGLKLIEVETSSFLPFDRPLGKLPLKPNKPFSGLTNLRFLENILEHIPCSGSSVFINGHGSDHIFMCPPSRKALSDYIIKEGFRGAKRTLTYITHFYRDSFFPILKENLVSLLLYSLSIRTGKRSPANVQHKLPRWLLPALEEASSSFIHPIYDSLPPRVPPGKYEQLDAFYESLAPIHGEISPINPIFYPFLSEPIIDLAFSFPTYALFDKGYDRYPLRQAISEYFKTNTIWRRNKGHPTGLFQLGVKKNLEYVLTLCLEGQFVKQSLVSREELEKNIILISNGDVNYLWSFIRLASIESFLKYWEE